MTSAFDRVGVVGGEVERLLGGVLGQFDDRLDHRLDAAVGEHHAAQHLVFVQFLDLGFDHHHRVVGAGDHQVHAVGRSFIWSRVGLSTYSPSMKPTRARADRAHERHAGEGQRRGGGDHGDDVGIVLEVVGEHGDDHLRLVLEALDEQRADRTVDQAGDQGFLLARARLRA